MDQYTPSHIQEYSTRKNKITQNNITGVTEVNGSSRSFRKNCTKDIMKTIKGFDNISKENIKLGHENVNLKSSQNFDFNQIQAKMQKILNRQLQKKGYGYIPHFKTLINVNNYIIRDFNIGGKSTMNSK